MKKCLSFVFFVLLSNVMHAQTIDNAIANAAAEISVKLQANTSIVVLDFQAPSENLTNYVIDELNGTIVKIGNLKPVERRQLSMVRSELTFNMSGEVKDESAQRIGQLLGAQFILMGSIETIGAVYRIRFKAITVETASIIYSFSMDIKDDKVLESLLAGSNARIADFTPEQRIAASALNLLLGSGSFFLQKDIRGGFTTFKWEGIGILTVVASHIMYDIGWSAERYKKAGETRPSFSDTFMVYGQYIGFAIYAGGAIYGVIRTQFYHKPGSQVTASPLNGLRLDLVSTETNHAGLQLSYNWKF
jgi:TolB-like protein